MNRLDSGRVGCRKQELEEQKSNTGNRRRGSQTHVTLRNHIRHTVALSANSRSRRDINRKTAAITPSRTISELPAAGNQPVVKICDKGTLDSRLPRCPLKAGSVGLNWFIGMP